jgi:hypothetical protein
MSSAGKCASIDVNQKVGGGELGGGCASFLPSFLGYLFDPNDMFDPNN